VLLVITAPLVCHGNAVLAWLTGPALVCHCPGQPNVEGEMVFSLLQSASKGRLGLE
jgi:hypothetical protein